MPTKSKKKTEKEKEKETIIKKPSWWKKFLSNWDKFDSIFGFIAGGLVIAFVAVFFGGTYTFTQIVDYLRPFAQSIILLVVFSYCMNKAFFVMKQREYPLNPKTFAEGFWGNFISVGWMAGGLFFIASSTPDLWRAIVTYLEK